MQSAKLKLTLVLAATGIAVCAPGAAMSQGQPIRGPDITRSEARLSSGLQWIDLEVPDFPPGAKVAVVHGDPNGNQDYVLRIRFPAGYRFPAAWHENSEHITVLTGTFLFAMGDTADEAELRRYGPGDFVYAPAGKPHYGGARGPTVIQVHGMGPFRMNMGKQIAP